MDLSNLAVPVDRNLDGQIEITANPITHDGRPLGLNVIEVALYGPSGQVLTSEKFSETSRASLFAIKQSALHGLGIRIVGEHAWRLFLNGKAQ